MPGFSYLSRVCEGGPGDHIAAPDEYVEIVRGLDIQKSDRIERYPNISEGFVICMLRLIV